MRRIFGSIDHVVGMGHREVVALRAAAARMYAKEIPDLTMKEGRAKVVRSLKRLNKTIHASTGRLSTANLWLVVMLVTCSCWSRVLKLICTMC
jgi:hypothetical protein